MTGDQGAAAGGSFLLFFSDAVLAEDIAEEIGLRLPGSPVRRISGMVDFMDALARKEPIRAGFIELQLLGPYWDAAYDRLRERGARIVLFGDAAEALAERRQDIPGVSILPRPWRAGDIERLLRDAPETETPDLP